MSRNKSISLTLVLVLATLFAGCGEETRTSANETDEAGASTSGNEVLVLDKSFDNSTMEVTVGVVIEVILDGNPTTGFDWTVMQSGSPVLAQRGAPEFAADSEAIGAGGTYRWRFDVAEAGTTELELSYARPFEEGVPPSDTFKVMIDAKG